MRDLIGRFTFERSQKKAELPLFDVFDEFVPPFRKGKTELLVMRHEVLALVLERMNHSLRYFRGRDGTDGDFG
jgi:hypothetical protein